MSKYIVSQITCIWTSRGPVQLGSREKNFIVCVIGYNLKNARKGNTTSKIAKWKRLRPLAKNVLGKQGLALQQLLPYRCY